MEREKIFFDIHWDKSNFPCILFWQDILDPEKEQEKYRTNFCARIFPSGKNLSFKLQPPFTAGNKKYVFWKQGILKTFLLKTDFFWTQNLSNIPWDSTNCPNNSSMGLLLGWPPTPQRLLGTLGPVPADLPYVRQPTPTAVAGRCPPGRHPGGHVPPNTPDRSSHRSAEFTLRASAMARAPGPNRLFTAEAGTAAERGREGRGHQPPPRQEHALNRRKNKQKIWGFSGTGWYLDMLKWSNWQVVILSHSGP